ncbi:MAG: type II toxin-antitoxin system Phd/YefM family antitoxin [Deltaproteobacteria bacterium]|nr:type II toxin-antitoxin system Phd/YefM family antitoxin [Deltaproteobacteria bacterium]
MEEVNALTVRNKLGAILDRLEKTGEPVKISKGRRVRAVLVTPDQFEKRFLDWQAEEKKEKLLQAIRAWRKPRKGGEDSLTALRRLRGYEG